MVNHLHSRDSCPTSLIYWFVKKKEEMYATFNPFPNKPWFLRVCIISLLKTLWEKEKLLIMSNFSFAHSVFCPFQEYSATFIKFRIVVCTL